MKKEFLAEAMDQISDQQIEEAAVYQKKKRVVLWRRLGAVAACLCLVIGGLLFWQQGAEAPAKGGQTAAVKEGITIPPQKVMLSMPEGVIADMVAFVIYEGRCYIEGQQSIDAPELVGEYLGTSTGLIDEWTPKDGYVDFAGSVAGDFYAVKGYDPEFMVCMNSYAGGVLLLVNNNGITLEKGADIFEEKLHLAGNFDRVQYQSRRDWYYGKGNIKTFDASYDETLEEFVAAVNDAEFMLLDDIPLEEGQTDVYDAREICHLNFYKEDGMVIHLRCFEGGYVQYAGVPDVCVKIDQNVFDAVCSAAGKR